MRHATLRERKYQSSRPHCLLLTFDNQMAPFIHIVTSFMPTLTNKYVGGLPHTEAHHHYSLLTLIYLFRVGCCSSKVFGVTEMDAYSWKFQLWVGDSTKAHCHYS